MKLKAGSDVLVSKRIGLLVSAGIQKGKIFYMLHQVSISIIEGMRRNSENSSDRLVGFPMYISHDEITNTLHFFPAANVDTKVVIYYYPPVKKI